MASLPVCLKPKRGRALCVGMGPKTGGMGGLGPVAFGYIYACIYEI